MVGNLICFILGQCVTGAVAYFLWTHFGKLQADVTELTYDMVSEGDAHRRQLMSDFLNTADSMYNMFVRLSLRALAAGKSASGQEASIAVGNMAQVDVMADTEMATKLDAIRRGIDQHTPFQRGEVPPAEAFTKYADAKDARVINTGDDVLTQL